jgi:hypothetical protein
MKRSLPILALLAGHAFAVENSVPSAFTPDRYEKLIEKSPFALATPVVAPAAPQASFAANWYLTAVGRDAQGQDFVTVKAQDNSLHLSLTGRDAYTDPASPANGVSIASVDWSDTFRKTTVILKKGTETAKVIFSQEEAMAPAPNAVARGGPAGPGPLPPVTVRQGAGGVVQTQMKPSIPLPRPSSPSVVAQPPQPVVQGQQPGAVVQPAGENRRRVRNIAAPE